MKLSDIRSEGLLYNPDVIKYFILLGGQDKDVIQDTQGNFYFSPYDYLDIVSPLFTNHLFGTHIKYPAIENLIPIIDAGLCVDFLPSTLNPCVDSKHISVWDNFYIEFKGNMWEGSSYNTRRNVKSVLSSSLTVREIPFLSIVQLEALSRVYKERYGTLRALEDLRYYSAAASLIKNPTWLGLYDNEKLLAVGHFSENYSFDGSPVFVYNQYFILEPCRVASVFLLKSAYYLAEKHGDILVDTTYRCEHGEVSSVYDYKRRVSNKRIQVYGTFVKPKNKQGYAPPYIEV